MIWWCTPPFAVELSVLRLGSLYGPSEIANMDIFSFLPDPEIYPVAHRFVQDIRKLDLYFAVNGCKATSHPIRLGLPDWAINC